MKVPTYKVCGGMQLFVDIDNAFDAINREILFSKLHELGVDSALVTLLTTWHCGTCYHITHLGEDHAIPVGNGLRQGCRAAPYLWNCFVALCLTRMAQRLDLKFIRENITIFADDMHIGGTFHDHAELIYLNQAFGIFLDTLREFELLVNPAKSAVILAMAGTAHRPAWHKLTQRDNKGFWARIDMPDGTQQLFPVVKSTKYLGAVVSYGSFEDQTLKHRLQMAKICYHRLHKWLNNHNGLPVHERFKPWQSCVLTTMQYGLFATGITDTGLKTFQSTVHTMIRTVIHDHSYVTRRTNAQALTRLHIDSPLALLHRAALQLGRTVKHRVATTHADDILRILNWQPLEDLIRRLEYWIVPGPTAAHHTALIQAPTQPMFFCDFCDFYTDNAAHLRRHCTAQHGRRLVRSRPIQLADFALHGMPQCKHCYQTFTSWRAFGTHAQRGCQALHPGPAPLRRHRQGDLDHRLSPHPSDINQSMQPERAVRGDLMLTDAQLQVIRTKPWGTALLTIVPERDFHRLHHERESCQYLTEYCCLCGLHVGRLQSMNLHMRTYHADYWNFVTLKSTQLSNLHSSESPCNCCGAIFRHQHTCPTWTQVALLLLYGGGLPGSLVTDAHTTLLRCELCHEIFENPAALTGHLQAAHGLAATQWNQSRDSIDNSPACAHCGTIYSSMTSLRSHISQGRCPLYNPEATPETMQISPQWLRYCVQGKLLELYNDPMAKLRLTLHCQCCDRRYQRSMDLSLHLQTAHAALWHAAQGTIGMLVESLYSKRGCVCNPSTTIPRVQHVCVPFKQIAMQFHRQTTIPLMPFTLTDDDFCALLSSNLPRAHRFELERTLAAHRFEAFWEDETVLAILRSHCLLCGNAHEPAALCFHIHQDHVCAHFMIQYYVNQLLPKYVQRQQNDYQCASCGQIFNLPQVTDDAHAPRLELVQTHLSTNCPCLLQTGILLATIINGGSGHGSSGRTGCDADGGRLSKRPSDARQVPTPGTGSTSSQASKRPRQTRTSGRRSINRQQGQPDAGGTPDHGNTV